MNKEELASIVQDKANQLFLDIESQKDEKEIKTFLELKNAVLELEKLMLKQREKPIDYSMVKSPIKNKFTHDEDYRPE